MTEINRTSWNAKNPTRRRCAFWARAGLYLSRPFATRVEAIKATYPEVPAGWPNRATRRAVKFNRFNRLTGEWRQVLVNHIELVPHIRAL